MVRGTAPAVFLDRDGVIVIPEFRNRRSYAPTRFEDFRLYPDARASLDRLKQAGFVLVVVTNQPDVGKGLIAPEVIDLMHRSMEQQLPLDSIKTCIHTAGENCDCRKPKPGMILAAASELNIDLGKSFMVGDRKSDVDAGRAAGCATIFIDLEYDEPRPDKPDFIVRSIAEAVEAILQTAEPMEKAS